MNLKSLMRRLLTIVCICTMTTAMAEDFEQVLNLSRGIIGGVGFMKPGQSLVYYKDRSSDPSQYVFCDKDFKVFACLDEPEESLLSCTKVLSSNNLFDYQNDYTDFTQTFFNEDEDIEYCLFLRGDNKTTLEIKQVISGKTIATLEIKGKSVNCEKFLNMAGNNYIEFEVSLGNMEYAYQIYRVNGSNSESGTFTLVSERKVNAYPNPVIQGDNFNLDLLGYEEGVVTIFDINGRYIKTVDFKEEKVSISTEDMSQGMYVYNVQSKGKIVAKNKLIIK